MALDRDDFFVPRLSGGIFLSLLEASKKSSPVVRKQFGANGSGISIIEMLMDLVHIADPSRPFPSIENFKSSVTNYRKCDISKAAFLPFDDQGFKNTFSDRITQNYETVLADMNAFVQKYFDPDNESASVRLVKGLLETIQKDDSITDIDIFVYSERQSVNKAQLCSQPEYDLAAFLLAIWFYVIQLRPDNSVGKETFLHWHSQSGERAPWQYVGDAGATITRTITVHFPEPMEKAVDESPTADKHVESSFALDHSNDIELVNNLWSSVQGTRLEPIKKADEIAPQEMAYVYPLLNAYGQNLKRQIMCKNDLPPLFQTDLEVRRQHFYDAETVRLQGEQALGSIIRDEFDDLKNDILSSVWNTYMDDYPDGFRRMKRVMDEASKANCTKGNLVKTGWIGSGEKQGIGHMLAAEQRLVWVVDDNA